MNNPLEQLIPRAQGAVASEVEILLQSFLGSIVELVGAQAGAVRVVTDDGKFLRLVAQRALPESVLQVEQMVGLDCGMCGSAATTKQLAWVTANSPCAIRDANGLFGHRCKQMLVISLTHGEQIFGVYNLFFDADLPLEPHTENILRLLGQLLGQTIANAKAQRERLRESVMHERQEMVNEVHDAIAQTLAYVRMRLPLLSDAMLAHDDKASLKYFSDVKTAVGEVHDNLREVMTYFRTRMDPLGLVHALRGIAEGYFDRTGITLELRDLPAELSLTDAQEIQVFHVIQEALANVVKHAQAKAVVLSVRKAAGELEFIIEDDGLGMATMDDVKRRGTAQSGHYGIEIMQSRAQRLGGRVRLTAREGGGALVSLKIPVIAPRGAFE